ncbi:MAG: class I SAM-dependent methyltransferase [Planctomycetota bacterium]|nr:class I SAM-dependent methyltransferase [Planctomycetota bacterium]
MARKKSKKTLAQKADKYKCYLKSVQSPEHEVEFFDLAFREAFGRKPVTLREDFCGTFAVCCEWIKLGKKRTAMAVDLDSEPLDWGRAHNFSRLKPQQQSRIRVLQQDVRKQNRPRVDVLAAQNFSFWIFKTRDELREYFRVARSNMADEGVMIMDMMGGGDCYAEGTSDKRVIKKGKKGFSYHWEQGTFNPVNHDANFYISFKFKDGSKLKHAFHYQWRFWTIPEVRELLQEAGFSQTHVYWEREDEDGEDTGEWERGDEAPSNPSWLCYIVAIR